MKKILILFSTFWALLFNTTSAQFYNDDLVLQAYQYRDDIAPEVIETAKNWKRPGVLHGNWIENRDGKSVYLDGTDMFPDIEYLRIREYYPGIYRMTQLQNGREVEGLVRADGQQVIPIKYKSMFISDTYGYISGTEYAESSDGKTYNNATDLYDLGGRFIKRIAFQTPSEFGGSINVRYHKDYNLIEASYYPTKSYSLRTYTYFYPDGQLAVGPIDSKKGLAVRDGVVTDFKKDWPIPNSDPDAHPRLQHDRAASQELISETFRQNPWIQKASQHFDRGEWEQTLTMLNLYDQFDKNLFLTFSPEVFSYDIMWLRSHHALGHNREIYEQIANQKMAWYGLWYDKKKREITFPTITSFASGQVEQAWQGCQDIFNEAASVVLAEEAELRRQRNAELWAVALGALAGTVHEILGSSSSSQSASSSSTPASRIASSSSSSSSGTSSSSSDEEENKKETKAPTRECPDCHGYGKVREKTYSGSITRTEKHKCEECGREYSGQDKCISHRTCNRCHGLGKI